MESSPWPAVRCASTWVPRETGQRPRELPWLAVLHTLSRGSVCGERVPAPQGEHPAPAHPGPSRPHSVGLPLGWFWRAPLLLQENHKLCTAHPSSLHSSINPQPSEPPKFVTSWPERGEPGHSQACSWG